jgi:D-alanine-D-alanine ligase
VHDWAKTCYSIVYGTGAPRIDFLCNSATGELWLNEVNPCPGSFGYFLWEASSKPILFSDLLSSLIDEAFAAQRSLQLPPDPTHPEARLFPRA